MRRKNLAKKLLPVEVVLRFLGRITMSNFHKPHNSYIGLALVCLLLPCSVLGKKTSDSKLESSPAPVQIVDTIVAEESGWTGRSVKGSGDNNALLANIDFLTQLSNNKQEKESEMDPLKCFPKALCGLSAESAAITRRRKNGLITDYIRLMKAVALNPSVMENTLKKLHEPAQQQVAQDDTGSSGSDEDDDDDDDEEDEDRRRMTFSKRRGPPGYGFGSAKVKPKKKSKSPSPTSSPAPLRSPHSATTRSPPKKRAKKGIPEDSDEFHKQYLFERAHVEKLMEDGFYNEETDTQNWWNYQNEEDPSLENLLDDDSNSVESFYTFGGKKKPNPPTSPYKPNAPDRPEQPEAPDYVIQPQDAPPRPQPPNAPAIRRPSGDNDNEYSGSGPLAAVGDFFRNLFGFGSSRNGFSNDAFFQGFQRSMPDGTPTIVTVDKTKEILTTAIEIGESLRSPNQCNTLFNGCKYEYIELLHVIDDIRNRLADKGKVDFETLTYTSAEEVENYSGSKVGNSENKHSYGYQLNLSGTSQAETLSPDYAAGASKARRKAKKKSKSKSSSEDTLEIGSDEPTLYGSIQHSIDNKYKDGRPSPSSQYHYNHAPQLQHHNYHNSYYSEYDNHNERPAKSVWSWLGHTFSWFGFGRN